MGKAEMAESFVLRRIAAALPSLIGIVVATFILARALPGDPAVYFAGPAANAESVEQVRVSLGLDKSWPEQFWIYVTDITQGSLGTSLTSGQPVLDDLTQRLPASLELTFCALIFAVAIAVPLGVLAAVKPNSIVDHVCRALVTVAAALPTFFIGLLLVYVFYYILGWSPQPLGRLDEIYFVAPERMTGFFLIDSLLEGNLETFRAALAQLVLPSIALGLFALAPIARMTRATMLTALGSDYVRTARANGLSGSKVLFAYAFRNALLPITNVLGMVFSFLLGSNVLVEQVFGWPGVGSYGVSAVIASDYAAVQGFVLLMALLYMLLNLGVDILAGLIDPRLKAAA